MTDPLSFSLRFPFLSMENGVMTLNFLKLESTNSKFLSALPRQLYRYYHLAPLSILGLWVELWLRNYGQRHPTALIIKQALYFGHQTDNMSPPHNTLDQQPKSQTLCALSAQAKQTCVTFFYLIYSSSPCTPGFLNYLMQDANLFQLLDFRGTSTLVYIHLLIFEFQYKSNIWQYSSIYKYQKENISCFRFPKVTP